MHLRIYVKDFFWFAEHPKNATCGLGYKLTLKRSTKIDTMNKVAGTAKTKTLLGGITCFVLCKKSNVTNQRIFSGCIVSGAPTEKHYRERFDFEKVKAPERIGFLNQVCKKEMDAPFYFLLLLSKREFGYLFQNSFMIFFSDSLWYVLNFLQVVKYILMLG